MNITIKFIRKNIIIWNLNKNNYTYKYLKLDNNIEKENKNSRKKELIGKYINLILNK